jgi:hypothetical protein
LVDRDGLVGVYRSKTVLLKVEKPPFRGGSLKSMAL